MNKIEDDIEEDREGRSKDEMDEKFLIKTVPNCKNIFGSEVDQGPYTSCKVLVNGCCSSILYTLSLRVEVS